MAPSYVQGCLELVLIRMRLHDLHVGFFGPIVGSEMFFSQPDLTNRHSETVKTRKKLIKMLIDQTGVLVTSLFLKHFIFLKLEIHFS